MTTADVDETEEHFDIAKEAIQWSEDGQAIILDTTLLIFVFENLLIGDFWVSLFDILDRW